MMQHAVYGAMIDICTLLIQATAIKFLQARWYWLVFAIARNGFSPVFELIVKSVFDVRDSKQEKRFCGVSAQNMPWIPKLQHTTVQLCDPETGSYTVISETG